MKLLNAGRHGMPPCPIRAAEDRRPAQPRGRVADRSPSRARDLVESARAPPQGARGRGHGGAPSLGGRQAAQLRAARAERLRRPHPRDDRERPAHRVRVHRQLCSLATRRCALEAARHAPSASAGTHPAERIEPGAIAAAQRTTCPSASPSPAGCRGAHRGRLRRDRLRSRPELVGDLGELHWSVRTRCLPAPMAFDRAAEDLAQRVADLAPRLSAARQEDTDVRLPESNGDARPELAPGAARFAWRATSTACSASRRSSASALVLRPVRRRAAVVNFLPLLAERYARQRLRALARRRQARRRQADRAVLCVHNAGRSQMALGFFEHYAGDQAVAWSGGSEPGDRVNPSAIAAMQGARGIDISTEFPSRGLTRSMRAAGRGDHDGLRRRLPGVPRQALRGMGARGSGRQGCRGGSARCGTTSSAGSCNCWRSSRCPRRSDVASRTACDRRTVTTEVLVVGAGPTGLMAAVSLQRMGVSVVLVDGKSGPTRVSRALGLQARSLEILDQVGLADAVLQEAWIAPGVAPGSRTRTFGRVEFTENGRADHAIRRASTSLERAEPSASSPTRSSRGGGDLR